MKKQLRAIFAIGAAAAALALNACSSMSAQECQALDWRAIGYEDGVAGYPANRIGFHRKTCGKHGVTPNFELYQVGRNEGLKEFCKPQVGFQMGSQGYRYEGICPAELARPFEDAYDMGRELHAVRESAQNAESELQSARHEIQRNEEAMVSSTATIVGLDASVDRRAQAAIDIKHLAERNEQLRRELPRLERERDRALREYEKFKSRVPY